MGRLPDETNEEAKARRGSKGRYDDIERQGMTEEEREKWRRGPYWWHHKEEKKEIKDPMDIFKEVEP